MTLTLYELAGADRQRRFSPFCWRTRMALKHKNLQAESVPVCFTEKEIIAFSGSQRVPVLRDGGTTVTESFDIALYLEDTYPDAPSLFGAGGPALARFVNQWADSVLHPAMLPLLILDILERIDDADKDYFRESREKFLGATLEDFATGRSDKHEIFLKTLAPLRGVLSHQPFLCGDAPAHGDYIVFGSFQWARCSSDFELLAGDDSVYHWRERLLDHFDGYGRDTVCG